MIAVVVDIAVAALAALLCGMVWHLVLGKRWALAVGAVPAAADAPVPSAVWRFAVAALAQGIVAAVMWAAFDWMEIRTLADGVRAGIAAGGLLITPWLAMVHVYAARPLALIAMDGGYAVLGCGVIGAVLTGL